MESQEEEMLKEGWAHCELPGGRTREEAEGDHPIPTDLPAALGLGADAVPEVGQRAGRQVAWMWQELADCRRHSSSREQGWGQGAQIPPAPAGHRVCPVIQGSGGISRPDQQPPSGRTLATWELQEVDTEQKRH